MTITARYAATCSACHQPVTPGQQIEWERGAKTVRHTNCSAPAATEAPKRDRDAKSQPIGAKGTYQGRPVYVVARTGGYQGREVRGYVRTRDGAKMLVVLAGGQRTAWVPAAEITIERQYERAWTFAGVERAKRREERGEGCSFCGRLSCEGARGSLCEHD